MTKGKSAPSPERHFERGGRANDTTSNDLNPAGGTAQPDEKTFEFRSGTLLANVRAVVLDNVPWFYTVDVCDALELTNPAVALLSVDAEDKTEHKYYLGSGRKPLLVNESGLYSLIFKSRKPAARQFKRWVTAEVLPSIRSTGCYAGMPPVTTIDFSDPAAAAAARAWADAYEARQQITGYAHRQAKYIDHLENLFTEGLTPVQFCRRLNGVNTSKVSAWLMEKNWLYDDTPNSHRATWRVLAYARDQYLTETSKTTRPNDYTSFEAFSPVLLKKGAVWLYRHYLKGELPMKTDWNGEYTHDKELAQLVGAHG